MSMNMDPKRLKSLAAELAKEVKTEADLGELTQMLVKLTVETALNAELTEHLGYDKHDDAQPGRGNTRNGTSSKKLKTTSGEVEIDTPRDRDGSFEPQLVRKHQTRLTKMDDQILALYAKGLSTRDIVDTFKEMYLALGINLQGHKELLGLWISENEGAKFWLSVLTELKN